MLVNSYSTIPRLFGASFRQSIRRIYDKKLETYLISQPSPNVCHAQLNRPEKMNAMNMQFWDDTTDLFSSIHAEKSVRSIVLSGNGKAFSTGLDLQDFSSVFSEVRSKDAARVALSLKRFILKLQTSISWLERELELGLAADLGTLQRLPHLVGSDSLARELVYTARRFDSAEALQSGFVSRVFETSEQALEAAFQTAEKIASLSPVAMQTTKTSMIYARDHGVMEGLENMANLNQVMLQSEDLAKSFKALLTKQKPVFDDA